MVRFPATSNKIAELEAIIPRKTGLHLLQRQAVSVGGLDMGSTDFDAARHLPHMIDPLAVMAEVTGTPQVRIQKPANPLLINIVADLRNAGDDPRIRSMKDRAIQSVLEGLTSAVPNLDPSFVYRVEGDHANPEQVARDNEGILQICSDGLCFVISDFKLFKNKGEFSPRADVLALKVNHPLERKAPSGVGSISLGGLVEIDTDDPRQVDQANQMLGDYHASIIDGLLNCGVKTVGSGLVMPNLTDMIDAQKTDEVLAKMVSSLS